MTLQDIKELVMFQVGNDAEDLPEFEPFIDGYVNEGYDLMAYAYAKAHVGDAGYPALSQGDQAPLTPDWTHAAIADYATWLVYRNGNPQKQQRGMQFYQAFSDVQAKVYAS